MRVVGFKEKSGYIEKNTVSFGGTELFPENMEAAEAMVVRRKVDRR